MSLKELGYVYTLRLDQNKYYVGHTKNIELRMHQHCQQGGSKWCEKYAPIEVMSVKYGDEILEKAQTALMMSLYGWENVRGSEYCKVDMILPPLFLTKRNQDIKFITDIKQGK